MLMFACIILSAVSDIYVTVVDSLYEYISHRLLSEIYLTYPDNNDNRANHIARSWHPADFRDK
jgi:hypothetical protein